METKCDDHLFLRFTLSQNNHSMLVLFETPAGYSLFKVKLQLVTDLRVSSLPPEAAPMVVAPRRACGFPVAIVSCLSGSDPFWKRRMRAL
jgi:NOP5NT (NUC127) domain